MTILDAGMMLPTRRRVIIAFPMATKRSSSTGRYITKMRTLSASVSKRNNKIRAAKSAGTTTRKKPA